MKAYFSLMTLISSPWAICLSSFALFFYLFYMLFSLLHKNNVKALNYRCLPPYCACRFSEPSDFWKTFVTRSYWSLCVCLCCVGRRQIGASSGKIDCDCGNVSFDYLAFDTKVKLLFFWGSVCLKWRERFARVHPKCPSVCLRVFSFKPD